MCNFNSNAMRPTSDKRKATAEGKGITSNKLIFIAFFIITLALPLGSFIITQVIGNGAGKYTTISLIVSISSFILSKCIDVFISFVELKHKNMKIGLLFIQYILDVLTPLFFIVGFIGYSTTWYVIAVVASSVSMAVAYGRKLILIY